MFDVGNIFARSYERDVRFNACKLAPKLLKHHPYPKRTRKQICHTLQSKNIHKNNFSLKSAEK